MFFATTFLIYAMVFALPGDPILALAGDKPVPAQVLAVMRARYHLDEPLLVQYGRYMLGVFHGDLGETFTGQPVSELLQDRWAITTHCFRRSCPTSTSSSPFARSPGWGFPC